MVEGPWPGIRQKRVRIPALRLPRVTSLACTTGVAMAVFLEYWERSVRYTQMPHHCLLRRPHHRGSYSLNRLSSPRVSLHTGMVRLSELRSTAQSPRPTRPTAALPDSIITQREEAQSAEEEEEEAAAEPGAEAAEESRPRRRRPARPPEPEERVRGKRQKDFDLSEQQSSDEESQQRARARAAEEPWTQNQQKLLELALQQYPRGSSDRWDKIAKCVPSKSKVGDARKGLWGLQTQGSALWPHPPVPHLAPPILAIQPVLPLPAAFQ